MNSLLHNTEVVESHTVETAGQLREALSALAEGDGDYLDKTYVIQTLAERLSDGSYSYSIRIREAEAAA